MSDDEPIAEAFSKYFINIGMKMVAESRNDSSDLYSEQGYGDSDINPPKKHFHFSNITVSSLFVRLQKFNFTKATGNEGGPTKILKMISSLIARLA